MRAFPFLSPATITSPRLLRLSLAHFADPSPSMASSASSCAMLPAAPFAVNGARRSSSSSLLSLASRGLWRSRASMSVSVGSQTTSATTDVLFQDYKASCAFFFPGQGAQTVGMGVEAQNVPAASELFRKANNILGFDLLDVCANGPKEKLDSTVISQEHATSDDYLREREMRWSRGRHADEKSRNRLSQPAIYVTSLAAVEVLRARDGGQAVIDSVDVTCGLSLGEYTALAFAGAFSFEDGLKLVKLRGEAMQDAANSASSAMVSVIGLDADKVQLLCDAANEEVDEQNKVQIANFLCPGNYAVSGGVKGVEAVEAKAKSFKARMTVRLAVAGAFHTSFMEPAVSRLEAALAATEIRQPRITVISNVDALPHTDPERIKKILARQVTSPVQWELTVKTLLSKGLKKSYELGPGKVIAGILKRMDKSANLENIGA